MCDIIKLWYNRYQEKRTLNKLLFYVQQALIFCEYDDNQQMMIAYKFDEFIKVKKYPTDDEWKQIYSIKPLLSIQQQILKSTFKTLYFYKVGKNENNI